MLRRTFSRLAAVAATVSVFQVPLIGALPTRQNAAAQREYTDLCHVYAIDIKLGEEAVEATSQLPANPTEDQIREFKQKYASAERILGQFTAKVGEEEQTTQVYRWSANGPYIIATVYYTDETMASRGHSDSVTLAILVSPKAMETALGAEGNAETQMSYAWESDKIQVKTTTRFDGRVWRVGLECQVRIGTLHPEIVGPEGIFDDRSKGPPSSIRIPIPR